MKRQIIYSVFLACCISFLPGCIEIEKFDNSSRGNFEALWKIIDEQYCFLDYKDVDWDEIYKSYSSRINDRMDQESLFMLLDEMLQELKDGHVNLVSPFDIGRYWKWFEDYPSNFNSSLIDDYYLKKYYSIAGGIRYKVLEDNIGYMYYGDFSSGLGETNLDYIIDRLAVCEGIIIDVRDNGGGLLSNAEKLASRFVNEKTLVGYIQHKTGKGHNDFSTPHPRYIEPNGRLRYQKPVVVLTNRSCYSATNDFVNSMKTCPNVTILGDRTGGGSGLPFTSEIPNGWSVRFSACPMYDAEMNHLEFGIDPDIRVDMNDEDAKEGKDTIIETARELIRTKK
ncbi:S41 family peptidase [Bacteroidales bacterium OttesenSCG-928-A17]|nr:S41 family peptidase [Bacteroidales bacterium OttesenSCG-928-A17]